MLPPQSVNHGESLWRLMHQITTIDRSTWSYTDAWDNVTHSPPCNASASPKPLRIYPWRWPLQWGWKRKYSRTTRAVKVNVRQTLRQNVRRKATNGTSQSAGAPARTPLLAPALRRTAIGTLASVNVNAILHQAVAHLTNSGTNQFVAANVNWWLSLDAPILAVLLIWIHACVKNQTQ